MSSYIDGFVLPIPKVYIKEYQNIAEKVGNIWKEYGAIGYYECLGDDLMLDGTRSFLEVVNAQDDEVIMFGWVIFNNKADRDLANQKVPNDKRMHELVAPLANPDRLIFNARRMVYGGFKTIVH